MTDLQPPRADRRPVERTFHGDTVTDEYTWLADRDDPEVIAYLEAENAYTAAATGHLADLRETLFTEIKTRTKETDLSLPVRHHQYWYYTRTEEGQQYGIHCRVLATPGEDTPPSTEGGKPLPGEEIFLDENALAEGHDYFELGDLDMDPSGTWLAYSTDFTGDERYTIRIRNATTGEMLADEITGVSYGSAWSADASVLFYSTVDDAWRSYRVWRHVIGTPTGADEIIYEEPDERFSVDIAMTRSERFLLISSNSKITSEVRFLPADAPLGEPVLIAPRRDGVEYGVTHHGHRFVILHNDGALDYELAYTPVDRPGEWVTLLPHEPGVRLIDVDAFARHLVVSMRRDGLTTLRVMPLDGGAAHDISFPEPIYTVALAANLDYDITSFRLSYNSLGTPRSVYDCDLTTGALTLRRQSAVLPDTHGRPFDAADYEQHREWAIADDGTRVPISIICRRDTPRDGSAPLVLYGYGSYEVSMDAYFSIPRLCLVDRGVVYAVAHVRGGGEMGRRWYDEGKLLAKKTSFTDFIACSRHLVAAGWTTTERLIARGGSAGGLLVGAAVEMAPDAFGGVVATVPFVDTLTTILDPSKPLTVTEWDEWGDPLHDPDYYRYIKSYAPYENVGTVDYPPMLVLGSLNDTRVSFVEPAKWVARLRHLSPGTDVLLKMEMGAGHGGPSGRYDMWREETLIYAWILDRAGLAGD